jgi:hypothetical protein
MSVLHAIGKRLSFNSILSIFLILVGLLGLAVNLQSTLVRASSSNSASVCPNGNGWKKYEATDVDQSNNKISYSVPEGQVVLEVCAKGAGEETKKPHDFFFTTYQNGVAKTCDYTLGGKDDDKNRHLGTITVEGIGSSSASVSRQSIIRDGCAEISHASFLLETIQEPIFACNSECTSDSECQGVNADFQCVDSSCRLASNPESETCEASTPPTPAPTLNPSPTPSSTPAPENKKEEKKDEPAVGGVSTEVEATGQVLGASTLANTGLAADLVMAGVGASGALSTVLGTILYAKKSRSDKKQA